MLICSFQDFFERIFRNRSSNWERSKQAYDQTKIPIFDGTNITLLQFIVLMLRLKVKNHLSIAAFADILDVINLLVSDRTYSTIPTSWNNFKQVYSNYLSEFIRFDVC